MEIESYKLKGWKEKISGALIDENEEWILIKSLPVDYVIDGFTIIRKDFLKSRKAHKKADIISKVLRLKAVNLNKPKDFEFTTVLETLKWSENKYGLFEFRDDSKHELFYGKTYKSEGNILIIDMILSDGTTKQNYDYEFELNQIRTISFESDYFTSIVLLMNSHKI